MAAATFTYSLGQSLNFRIHAEELCRVGYTAVPTHAVRLAQITIEAVLLILERNRSLNHSQANQSDCTL